MLECIALDSLTKVFEDEKPAGGFLQPFSMFLNERAAFQAALYTDTALTLTAELDIEPALAGRVTVALVRQIHSSLPCYKDHDSELLRSVPGLFPDLLEPVEGPFTLEAGKWLSLWFEILPGGEVEPRDYRICANFLSEGTVLGSVCAAFSILPASLPRQELIYTDWFHTDCLATHYGIEVFSEDYWRITENYLKTAADHGVNMVLTPLFTPPLDTMVGGERPTVQLVDVELVEGAYRFGFEKLERWVAMAERCGIEYFEMSHLFTQWGAKRAPKVVAVSDGSPRRIFGWRTPAGGKAYREFLAAFAPQLIRFIDAHSLRERCFFHVSDEPGLSQLRTYGKASKLLKDLFPGFTFIDALSDFGLYRRGAVGLPVPASNHIDDFAGRVPQLWTYYCCSQYKDRLSNRFFCMPSARTRVLGFQLFQYNVRGFLHWGYNFWYTRFSLRPVDPLKETDAGGAFPSGDAFCVYPGPDGQALASLRLKVFYEGLQDLRALRLLESLCGREKTLAVLGEGLAEPLTFTRYPASGEWLIGTRQRINAAVMAALPR